jgi:hypothetical protein
VYCLAASHLFLVDPPCCVLPALLATCSHVSVVLDCSTFTFLRFAVSMGALAMAGLRFVQGSTVVLPFDLVEVRIALPFEMMNVLVHWPDRITPPLLPPCYAASHSLFRVELNHEPPAIW